MDNILKNKKASGILTIIHHHHLGFTEIISFFHNRNACAIVENSLSKPFKYNGNILNMVEATAIPFLVTQEYFYTLDSPIENDRLINFSLQNKIVLNLVIGRIKQFSVSTNDNFKKMFLENIPGYIECLGVDNASNFLIPALSKIVDEDITVKIQFLKIVKDIVDYLHSKGKIAYNLMANNLVRLVNELYTFQAIKNQQMKKLIFDNYLKIASCLEKEDLGKFLLTKILNLSIENNNSSINQIVEYENVTLITRIIYNFAHKFMLEHTETFIISNMSKLSSNPNSKIREAICSIIPPVARAVSLDVFQTRINEELYVKFTNDSNELVRKIALEILPELMKVSQEKSGFDPKYNNTFYIKVFKQFMLENNKIVNIAVIDIFGQFIHLLSIEEVHNNYLNFFTNTIDEYYANLTNHFSIEGKKELIYPAAFTFPAVLYRYGKESWPKLQKTFKSLANDSDEQIRFTLISSFHEIVTILGQETAEKELMTIYDSFVNNSTTKISSEAIKRLIKVINGLSNDVKSKYLKYYSHIIPLDEENKIHFENAIFNEWRHKVQTSQAIDCFFTLFPPIVIYHQILPVMISFCIDDYTKVRQSCSSTLAKIIMFLLNNTQMKKYSDKLIRLITTFGYSKCFYVRQTFCKMSRRLICDQGLYQNVLKDILFKLAYDKVKDVRISLGKMFVDTHYLLFDDDFYWLMSLLMSDEVLSVRNSILQKHKTNTKKLIEKCDEMKIKKMMSNNGIEEKKWDEEGKWCYLFNNDMSFFVDEFKIAIPHFALKRTDTFQFKNKSDYIHVTQEKETLKKIKHQAIDLNNKIGEMIKEEEENDNKVEIENGAINIEDNSIKNNQVSNDIISN